jgi:AcrR family transcriptional regulator
MVMQATSKSGEKNKPEIRRPTQERGRQRYEDILNSVEVLLQDHDPSDIGIYDISGALGISPQSVYHFFPEVSLVFVALAERYLASFRAVETAELGHFESWQDLLKAQHAGMLGVFGTNPAVRKVLLGVGYSSEIRRLDQENNRILAQHLLDGFRRHFVLPDLPDLHERFVEMAAINDAIWSLYLLRGGEISLEAERIAQRARVAYLRTVLPEYLTPRSNESQPQS